MTGKLVWRYWAPVVAYALFIFLLSSLSMPPYLGEWDLNDKIKHLALFAVFAWLIWRALAATRSYAPMKVATLTVTIVSVYGASDEFHQFFTPGRSCDWRDWAADTAAGIIVALTTGLMGRRPLRR